MAIAIALIVLALGSVLFHFLSPWYFTPIASNWHAIDTTIGITFWVTGIVFVAVAGFMAWALIRYRHRATARAAYQPENKRLEWWLMVLTAAGVAAMLAPGLLVWAAVVRPPDEAQVVEAVARQWNWSYRMPGRDGKLGTVNERFVTEDNPFGMNAADPNGADDVLLASPELHLPVGKPVKMLLRSKDVLHDFAVAQFRVKMDMVPGLVSFIWFTPTRTGTFDVLCMELCGVGHFAMRGRVVVDDPAAYQAWLDRQVTYAQTRAPVVGDVAAGKASFAVCASCHGANGEGNVALNAPKLSGQSTWYLRRQLANFKAGLRGTQDKDAFGKMMAPMAATLADDKAVANVVAYIASLPDTPAAPTLQGNVARGKARFETCANCHGQEGHGIAATQAPRLNGMSDWYMARQLKNFKDGVRGGHPQDDYGRQMGLIAGMLTDDAQIGDILAYVNAPR
jgi:cytochrome c oxidase subunit 2